MSSASAGHRPRTPRRAAPSAGAPLRAIESVPILLLLAVALLFGGSAAPLADLVVEFVAVIVLAIMAVRFDAAAWRATRPGWILALATIALALIQLVPLPFALWSALPGRAPAAELMALAGLGQPAHPLSLDPNATLSALLSFLAGLAAFIAALAAGPRLRRLLVGAILAGALVSALLGVLQISGNTQFYLYEHSDFDWVTGLFANHNHAADLFLIGIAIAGARLAEADGAGSGRGLIYCGLILVLGTATILTGSRVGMVLLGIELLAGALLLGRRFGRAILIGALACTVAAGVAGWAILASPVATRAADRFETLTEDMRPEIWRSTNAAVATYLPVGSGLGTFIAVYPRHEQPDQLQRLVINHAHNDYLELLLELGLLAPALFLAYLVLLGMAVRRLLAAGIDAASVGVLAAILVLLVHSAVEFPLRNDSLLVVFGLLNGILVAAARDAGGARAGTRRGGTA